MNKVFTISLAYFLSYQGIAQNSVEDYGKEIYTKIMQGNTELMNEFVDLNQYTSYIDRLEKLPQEEKELIKAGASKTYTEARKTYNDECLGILELYKSNIKSGATFAFINCTYKQSKNFPDIGLLTCFYTANIPVEEDPLIDAIVFECIKTATGWRILDGFYEAPEIN